MKSGILANNQTVISYILLIAGIGILIEGTIALLLSLSSVFLSLRDVGFGSIAAGLGFIAVGFAYRAEIVLKGIRRTEVNEKIAMLYHYAEQCRDLPSQAIAVASAASVPNKNIFFGQMFADIRAISSIVDGMKERERVDCRVAIRTLEMELRLRSYFDEANRVRSEFTELL